MTSSSLILVIPLLCVPISHYTPNKRITPCRGYFRVNSMLMNIATADIANVSANHSRMFGPKNSEYIPAIQTLQHLKQVRPSKKCPGSSEVFLAAHALNRSKIAPGPDSS